MPTLPPASGAGSVPRRETASTSLSFRDVAGRPASVRIQYPAAQAAALTLINLWRDAVGQASNAALVKQTNTSEAQISVTQAIAFDESWSSANAKANFVFENANLDTIVFPVPAPDLSMFAADRKTIDPTNAQAEAIIEATLDLLNGTDGALGTYAFKRGYLSEYADRGDRGLELPQIAEPGAGDLPPALPAP